MSVFQIHCLPFAGTVFVLGFQWGAKKTGKWGDGRSWSQPLKIGAATEESPGTS